MSTGYHHDGSALYVPNQAPELGDLVTVFVRGPVESGVERVYVRSTPDAEPFFSQATVHRQRNGEVWWRATVRVHNPVTNYRFLLVREGRHRWLTAAGIVDHDVPDDTDFRLVSYPAPPAWAADAVVYQIFPDRFARSPQADTRTPPPWAVPCAWDDPVIGRGPETQYQFYGGDLDGVAGHLDHIAAIGANAIYLTPFFPAGSTHRYDANSFDEVDPLLGGDKALARLADAVHQRGMRLIGDLTTNHTGNGHPWFTGPESRDLYYWNPDGTYESWLGVPTLPKLNWASAELRSRFFHGPRAVAARWLEMLDGWRVDVANMTGRQGRDDYANEVARLLSATVRRVRPDGLLIAEHTHDPGADLDRDGWQGTMNYAGFTRPVAGWLRRADFRPDHEYGVPGGLPGTDARTMEAVMRAFASRTSWRSLTNSWTTLGTHDTARIRTVVGDPALVEVAMGMLATFPGTPTVFAGDELGIEGVHGEDGRRTMPWSRPAAWHRPTLDRLTGLLALRFRHPALRHGGFRVAHTGTDVFAYWRETEEQRLLVMVRRRAGQPVRVDGIRGASNLYGGADLAVSGDTAVLPTDGPTVQVWACD